MRFPLLSILTISGFLFSATADARDQSKPASLRWYQGNLHTHSFWSDGDDFPEMIADWYKSHGYDFLAFSDHNSIQQGNKWVNIDPAIETRSVALAKYLRRFGPGWVEQKMENGKTSVRLKSFNEFTPLFNEPGQFLCVQAEEISDGFQKAPLHLGAINLSELIPPQGGSSYVETMQNNVNAVFAQREKTGQPMLIHVNHPNFHYAITAEELMQVKREQFFEVYNGHPTVYSAGDAAHPSTDRMWDIILTRRLTELNLEVMYGIATDDGHHYHAFSPKKSNPGRGWIVVRANALTPGKLIAAMEAGDFYASNGVKLKDVQRDAKTYSVRIEGEKGVRYTTQFIGTRKNFDPRSQPVLDKDGQPRRITRNYSQDVGVILAEVKGTSARYPLQGDEIYVRAKVISSKLKPNVGPNAARLETKASGKAQEGAEETESLEYEMAWTQPLVTGVK